jgi:hypothetical protein
LALLPDLAEGGNEARKVEARLRAPTSRARSKDIASSLSLLYAPPPPGTGAERISSLLPFDLNAELVSAHAGLSLGGGKPARVAVSNQLHDRPGPHEASRAPFRRLIVAMLEEHDSAIGTCAIRHNQPPCPISPEALGPRISSECETRSSLPGKNRTFRTRIHQSVRFMTAMSCTSRLGSRAAHILPTGWGATPRRRTSSGTAEVADGARQGKKVSPNPRGWGWTPLGARWTA